MASYSTLLLQVEDGIAHLRINRPEARNALNQAMVTEMHKVLDALQHRDDVVVLVISGEGDKAFLSGADIAELKTRGRADALRMINNGLFRRIERFDRPVIAAVHGWALGGGCELAMACDIRIAAEDAKLGQPEVTLGIVPGAGATYRLQRIVGSGHARELIFSGRIIDAHEAERIGLVNRVVAKAQLLAEAMSLAQSIARNGHWAVRFAKLSCQAALEMSTDGAMHYEAAAQALLFDDDEKHHRMQAFLDKRSRQ